MDGVKEDMNVVGVGEQDAKWRQMILHRCS